MSAPKKDKVILSEQGIVTEEALTAYLQNKLSPEEKQQLEKLLLEDPFAQDALEGLKSSLNQTAVISSISSINKKVRQRSGLKERKKLQIHWVNYAWAAVLFGLLVGIGFIMVNFLNTKENNLALNETKKPTAAPVMPPADTAAVSAKPQTITIDTTTAVLAKTDTIAVAVSSGTAAANTTEQKPAPAFKDDKAAKKKETINPAPSSIDAMQTKNSFTKNELDKAQNKDDKKTNGRLASDAEKANATADKIGTAVKSESAKKESKQDNRDPAALQDEAMKSFNQGDYNVAADDFDKILKHDPENADALYFGGISDYINGKTAKSESNFDKLLKKGSKYQEGSKWYKANILIKKGHSEAAKPLLQDLTNTNGSYKERAIKKLAEMGF